MLFTFTKHSTERMPGKQHCITITMLLSKEFRVNIVISVIVKP